MQGLELASVFSRSDEGLQDGDILVASAFADWDLFRDYRRWKLLAWARELQEH